MSATDDSHLGIYSTQRLESLRMTRHAVRVAVSEGRLTRIRPGWFHDACAHPDAIDAVRVGGILTATSSSAHHGMWTLRDDRLHVLVPRNASRLPDRSSGTRPVCVHWAKTSISRSIPFADPLQTVVDSAHCQPRTTAVILADSALNKRLITGEMLEAAIPRIAGWCDAGSQSGTETIARVGLRSRGIGVRSQVWIEGVGHVDLLVGERLVVECDSAEFHDRYRSANDYQRTQELIRRGYIVVRLTYRDVVHDWARAEALILEIVRAGRHEWRAGRGVRGTALAL
jgi:very-short-patch-repair endonuclease